MGGDLVGLVRSLVPVALAAVDPERLVRRDLADHPFAPTAALALGKAAAGLARGAEAVLPAGAPRLLLRPRRASAMGPEGWEEYVGAHPVPDATSLEAGRRLLAWLGALGERDRLLALVSGGGSACCELPVAGLTFDELTEAHRALVASGQPIDRINAVRRRLSALKGGGALAATRAAVRLLVLSDVPGDLPLDVASGPFVPDATPPAEARATAEALGLSRAVRRRLEADAPTPPLPLPEIHLLAGRSTAAEALIRELETHRFAVASGVLEGEAAGAGRKLVERGRRLEGGAGAGTALVLAGETTVRLDGPGGRGGRNQELALAAAGALAGGGEEVVLALATDGEDGPTPYAGAVVTPETEAEIARRGIDPAAALERHDATTALEAAGALLTTGPTGTNTADLAVYLGGAARRPARTVR